ncbi:MAG: heme A synthase, partial [Actinomycetota bacterium]|nr:heme A synthase [Actinomycetota bacterium]
TGLDPGVVAQLHADLVFLLLGLTIGTLAALVATAAPQRAVRAAWFLLAAELAQGLVGYVQYAIALPVLLVGIHLAGAAVVVVAAVHLLMTTRERDRVPAQRAAGTAVEVLAR